MLARAEILPPTTETIRVPAALARGILASGLTAPAMRAFVVLLGHADPSGKIDIIKPKLAEQAGVRLDNAHRFLEPLRESMIDINADCIDGEGHWFDDLTYEPGRRSATAGVIRGQISGAALAVLSHPDLGGEIPLLVAELRRLGTVPGILMYLHARALIGKSPKSNALTLRFDEAALGVLLGEYRRSAVSKTKLANGETSTTVSISRIAATLLSPGVDDLASAVDDFAVGMREGRLARSNRWKHVDVELQRLAPKKSLREMLRADRKKEDYLNDRRAERQLLKGKQSAQLGVNESDVGSTTTGEK